MSVSDPAATAALVKDLTRHCRDYRAPDTRRALVQLATTLPAYLAVVAFMMWGVLAGHYAALLAALPAGGLLVRLFIIQHDCGHGSFFASERANTLTGRLLSVLTWTPYGFWRRAHNMHHACSGNLDKRGVGSIDTLTVAEYRALPRGKRIAYRLYRHPLVMLLFGTPLHVMFFQRFPHGMHSPFFADYHALPVSQVWRSLAGLNLALFAVYGGLVAALDWPVLLALLPPVVIAAWVGGWLFFVQHQFENAYWKAGAEWDFHTAAVMGSSYYALPKWLQWFTGNIGLHHIHHLCSAVPNYRLQECLDGHAALPALNRLTLRESIKCARWALWDEGRGRMVAFADL